MIRGIQWYPSNEPGQRFKFKGELSKLGCCCGDACCLYPAAGLSGGFFHETDLPDTLVLTDIDPSILGSVTVYKDGSTYKLPDDDPDFPGLVLVELAGGDWLFGIAGGAGGDSCLVTDLPSATPPGMSEDEFPDNLTMDFDNGAGVTGSVVMTRTENICIWEGTGTTSESDPVFCTVGYGSTFAPYGWYGQWTAEDEFSSGGAGIKDGFQNTPIGSYNDLFGTIDIS